MCLHTGICTWMYVPQRAEEGSEFPGDGVAGSCEPLIWVLGTAFMSSAKAVSTLNQWAIPHLFPFKKIFSDKGYRTNGWVTPQSGLHRVYLRGCEISLTPPETDGRWAWILSAYFLHAQLLHAYLPPSRKGKHEQFSFLKLWSRKQIAPR